MRSGDEERCVPIMRGCCVRTALISPGVLHSPSFSHTSVVTPKSVDRRRLSTSSTLIGTPRPSPKDAAATLPSTVIVRGLSPALNVRHLRADREKCSVQVSPCNRDASVTASHAVQHGRSGMVTRSERDGDRDALRDGRRGHWGDPGPVNGKAEESDGER
jgi:hypothetical protein